jgi:23S rRNA pseudouridine2605 synthase
MPAKTPPKTPAKTPRKSPTLAPAKKTAEKKAAPKPPAKAPVVKPEAPAKAAPAEDEKLHKVLARAGIGSRREMERWITEGRVRINDRVAHLGDRVKDSDKVMVDGHTLKLYAKEETLRRVLIYNKPEGEICSRKDPEGRPTVFDALPPLAQGRWIAIGRLDFNTTGLLLFTNDGDLANVMMHPSTQIDREYLVRVLGEVDEEMLKQLKRGVVLEDGPARFTDITRAKGAGNNETAETANKFFYVSIMEGRNREVRRLWDSQGITVSRLKRVRYGNVFLPARVKRGSWIEMPKEEVDALSKMVGLKPQSNDLVTPQQKERFERQERRQQRIRTRAETAAERGHSAKPGTRARGAAKRRAADVDIERFGKTEGKRPPRKPAAQKGTTPKAFTPKPASRAKPDTRKSTDNRAPRPRKKP